ncbi:MAG: hypothetical protein QM500_19740 [Methylococcales bacterium]
MRKFKLHIIIGMCITYMVVTAFLSRGDSYIVESEEPLEDIVVICKWSSELRGLHGGTHSVTKRKGLIVESGEQFSCGFNWFAGLSLSIKSSAYFRHPTHRIDYKKNLTTGVFIYIAKSQLDILDEQKAKFESGYWGKEGGAGKKYYRSLPVCGISDQYLAYYKHVKEPELKRFIELYNDPILQCLKKRYLVMGEHDPYTLSKIVTVEERMRLFWNKKVWGKNDDL